MKCKCGSERFEIANCMVDGKMNDPSEWESRCIDCGETPVGEPETPLQLAHRLSYSVWRKERDWLAGFVAECESAPEDMREFARSVVACKSDE